MKTEVLGELVLTSGTAVIMWGDGVFPVTSDRDAQGHRVAVTIHFSDASS
jgi:hypothetical protein